MNNELLLRNKGTGNYDFQSIMQLSVNNKIDIK